MKSKKKTACIALAATLALSVTAFAANGLVSNWFSSSSSFADYKTLPTAQQVKKDIGYTPILIDSFANGYAFQDGNIISNNLTDENGNSIEKFKSVSFDYEKDGDIVIFAQDKYNSQAELQGSVAKTVGDTDIYYYSYTNKVVPADYEPEYCLYDRSSSGLQGVKGHRPQLYAVYFQLYRTDFCKTSCNRWSC